MGSLVDRRFEKLLEAIHRCNANGVIYFAGQSITVSSDNASLENIMSVKLNGKDFRILPELEDKAALAVAGMLGADCVAVGLHYKAIVDGRLAKARVVDDKRRMHELWGGWTNYIWKHKELPCRMTKACAEAARALMDLTGGMPPQAASQMHRLLTAAGSLPYELRDRKAGQWPAVVALVKALVDCKRIREQNGHKA